MTKEQALNLIDQVIAQYKGNREEHRLLREAQAILSKLVEKKDEPTPVTEP